MIDTEPTPSPKSDWRESLTWYTHETLFIQWAKFIVGIPFRLWADVECIGFENIPDQEACIVASNHASYLDIIYLTLHLPRHPHFMAKQELYKNPIASWFFRMGGTFPVERGEVDTWAWQQAGRVLQAGQMLCIFPEGTRSRTGKLKRAKLGAVKLALEHNVPILPVAISGTQNFRFDWRPRRPKFVIRCGRPLDMTALAEESSHEHKSARELTTILMNQIAEMLPPAYRGVYGDR